MVLFGFGGWASRSSKVMLCVIWYKGRKTGSMNTYENFFNKAEIHSSLTPGAKGFLGPSYSPSSISLAPIARRPLDDHSNVNHAALCVLQTVFIKDLKEHSST